MSSSISSPYFRLFDRLRRFVREMEAGDALAVRDRHGRLVPSFVQWFDTEDVLRVYTDTPGDRSDVSIASTSSSRSAPSAPGRRDAQVQIAREDVADVVPDQDLQLSVVTRGGLCLTLACVSSDQWQRWYHGLAFLCGERDWTQTVQSVVAVPPQEQTETPASQKSHRRDDSFSSLLVSSDDAQNVGLLDAMADSEHTASSSVLSAQDDERALLTRQLAEKEEIINELQQIIRMLLHG